MVVIFHTWGQHEVCRLRHSNVVSMLFPCCFINYASSMTSNSFLKPSTRVILNCDEVALNGDISCNDRLRQCGSNRRNDDM